VGQVTSTAQVISGWAIGETKPGCRRKVLPAFLWRLPVGISLRVPVSCFCWLVGKLVFGVRAFNSSFDLSSSRSQFIQSGTASLKSFLSVSSGRWKIVLCAWVILVGARSKSVEMPTPPALRGTSGTFGQGASLQGVERIWVCELLHDSPIYAKPEFGPRPIPGFLPGGLNCLTPFSLPLRLTPLVVWR